MSQGRPRLLVLGGPQVPAEDVARLLGDRYEVVVADPGSSVAALRETRCDVIMAQAGDYLPLERVLVDQVSRAVLNAIGEGICVAGIEGHILWANDRFKQYDEQTRARIESVCRLALQRLDERAAGGSGGTPGGGTGGGQGGEGHGAGPSGAGNTPQPGSWKFEVASADDAKYYEVLVSPVTIAPPREPASDDQPEAPRHAGAGRIDRVAAVVWDVTASRRMQQKMEAIDLAGRELVRLDADLIRRMHVGERLKLLEEKIVKFAHELMHFDHFTIRLLDERTSKLELVMASGLPPEALELELFAAREGSGISGYVAATGRSYLCPDIENDRRYVAGLTGAKSSLTVPLRLHDKVIGIFNVESERPMVFTEEDRQFAEMFANHIALALHILDLLVVERCATGESVTGTVQGELNEPLEDILHEADWLREAAGSDPDLRRHVERIRADVEAIRSRIREAAAGPQNILGAEKAMTDIAIDPAMVGKRILVADDEPRIRNIIRDVLRGRGCAVVVCDDGAAAIAELELASGEGNTKPFDLVISDIKMPDRNGYEVFSAARRVDAELPVILMTGFGYDPHHSIVRASQEGLQCVLFKPFQVERLLEEVRKAIAQRTPANKPE